MVNIKTTAIISVVLSTTAAIIYIINSQIYDETKLPPQNKERYHQAKVDVNGFEILQVLLIYRGLKPMTKNQPILGYERNSDSSRIYGFCIYSDYDRIIDK